MLEAKINSLIDCVVRDVGYEIVRIQYISEDKNKTLQIMIDKLNGQGIDVSDCSKISRLISPILDVEDLIKDQYTLEVSSPGVERPLIKPGDFKRFLGYIAKIALKNTYESQKKFKGTIEKAEEKGISLKIDDSKKIEILYEDIQYAHLTIDNINR